MAMNNTTIYTNKAQTYAFLSQPPPQKKRPTQPLPSPPYNAAKQQSTGFSATIAAWAAHVQPGSPAPLTPRSPHRRSSVSSRRRPSLGHSVSGEIAHGRVASSPLIITPTPTTASHKTFDFTSVGYNTVFLNMPKTPETPSPLLREKAMREQAIIETKLREKERAKEESKERKDKVMKRIKSLTSLRARSKSVSKSAAEVPMSPVPPLPTSPAYTTATAPAKVTSKSKAKAKAAKAKKSASKPSQRKKAVYGSLVRPPPTLHNELALMQFAEGGKMEDHIRRVMVSPDGAVGDVYRDGKGGLWWDREEEMEYRGLLLDNESSDEDASDCEADTEGAHNWVQFQRDSLPTNDARTSEDTLVAPEPLANKGKDITFERRESASTISSQDSDLDPAYLMQTEESPRYHDDRVLDFDFRASSNATETLKANNATSKRNGVLLCLPARPFRAAKHLRKPEFMVDLQAFGVIPKSPRSPLSPRFTNSAPGPIVKPRGKARRRPAPLKISPAMTKLRRVVAVSSPGSALPPTLPPLPPVPVALTVASDIQQQRRLIQEGKRNFILDSFQPEVSKFDTDSEYDVVQYPEVPKEHVTAGLKKRRGSMLYLRTLFASNTNRPF